jgi:hypothetical protein
MYRGTGDREDSHWNKCTRYGRLGLIGRDGNQEEESETRQMEGNLMLTISDEVRQMAREGNERRQRASG